MRELAQAQVGDVDEAQPGGQVAILFVCGMCNQKAMDCEMAGPQKKVRLPFSWGFAGGIAIVFFGRDGGGLCIRDGFRALKAM